MRLADIVSPAPREVRYAGLLTALPGFGLLAIGVILAVNHLGGAEVPGNNIYAEIGYYVVLALGVLACAVGLLLGKTWARSPSVVVALVLIGVGWYAAGPSGQGGFGVPVMIAGALVVVLLFRRASRAWVLGQEAGETEEEAARRGGAEGRASRKQRYED
ncbi:hypothetical protein BAY61_26035 [Prauserella marina]|uniref:Uncharacterized protein n=1 Tax=Prauserella marina TaxID=530584 RepID=A0A222VVZ4_9PSEU|nr:hypothetical protein [Prauserella marina]ASR37893.1 hypothetical protein BAY61_26035 [Prauserella marina]PWV73097.1 hypothetical protein DES30_10946 [Prauserella marina]SDD71910.1 hypothetical protein SAMN05421630_111227 [Prauserella marina]